MDSVENSANPMRELEAQAYHEAVKKKRGRPAKVSPSEGATGGEESKYIAVGKKVLLKVKKPTGTYTYYVGTRKEADEKGLKYEVT